MLAGVTIVNPAATVIDVDVEIAADTVIAPFTSLHGQTTIQDRVDGRPGRRRSPTPGGGAGDGRALLRRRRRDRRPRQRRPVRLSAPGHGPARGIEGRDVRGDQELRCRTGHQGAHLSYIGDADIGEQTNLGAATITANYDGHRKHRTTIGSRVKTSVDTTFVAPVSVGDDAYTGAGSVITGDVPEGALGVARARQSNIEGYAERRRERAGAGRRRRRRRP